MVQLWKPTEIRTWAGKSTIIDWHAEFKRARTNTEDAEPSDLQKLAVVSENITKVHKIFFGDRKLKLREIADTLKISKGSVYNFVRIFGNE